jgi:hypothetical protein
MFPVIETRQEPEGHFFGKKSKIFSEKISSTIQTYTVTFIQEFFLFLKKLEERKARGPTDKICFGMGWTWVAVFQLEFFYFAIVCLSVCLLRFIY